MAHKTLIGGTAYEIKGGRTLVGGTGYDIKSGRTLVGGTGYDVSLFTFDPTKTTYTESEFIATVSGGFAGQIPSGATITLNNSYCNSYTVIGRNHDSTSGTVDLMADFQVAAMSLGNARWDRSSLRTWINSTYYNAFNSTIRSLSKTMSVRTNGSSTVTDHVKILGSTEIGYTDYIYPTSDGTKYEYFDTYAEYGAYYNRCRNIWRPKGSYGGSDSYIWTRSQAGDGHTATGEYNLAIVSNGRLSVTSATAGTYIYGVLPVLRF